MAKESSSPDAKSDVYEAYRAGELSEERAREILGEDWEKALQLERVEEILDEQPDPDVQQEEFFR